MRGESHQTGAKARPRHGGALALGLLALAAVCFSLSNNLVGLSYDYGVNTMTALTARTWIAVVAIAVFCLLRGIPLTPARAGKLNLLWIGLLFSIQSFTLLASFKFIPVSLAVLLFFLFPLLVGLIGWATGDERMTSIKAICALAGFGGLALALDVFNLALDWRGVAFGLASAVVLALNIVGSHRAMRDQHALTVTFAMMVIAVVPYTLAILFHFEGGIALPELTAGWAALIAAIILGPLAILSFYVALAMTTGLRASMLMNGEPVLTIFFAALLFGERLLPIQYVGAAIVIAAIYAVTRFGHKG